ncbi:hypothetical protein NB564_01490 [Vibrio parahaemolyticus]|uniref:hypothetical protein n=1 Tax=Vibrio parahaemolyticus TaxID=670 RepID=UPI00215C8363|nr:hypothetical protein [Vibrio parahaemolyticus]MCR9949559.1 hypothetical protein [Vibrio parahaemolyticus]
MFGFFKRQPKSKPKYEKAEEIFGPEVYQFVRRSLSAYGPACRTLINHDITGGEFVKKTTTAISFPFAYCEFFGGCINYLTEHYELDGVRMTDIRNEHLRGFQAYYLGYVMEAFTSAQSDGAKLTEDQREACKEFANDILDALAKEKTTAAYIGATFAKFMIDSNQEEMENTVIQLFLHVSSYDYGMFAFSVPPECHKYKLRLLADGTASFELF